MCFACAKYPGVPEKYHALLDKALETSGTNQPELAKALESATPEVKEGVAFLISYMPERDLKTMKGDDWRMKLVTVLPGRRACRILFS